MKELSDAAGGWQRWRDERERSGTSAILAYAHRVLHYRDELRARGFFPEFYEPPADVLPAEPAASAPGGGGETAPGGPASE